MIIDADSWEGNSFVHILICIMLLYSDYGLCDVGIIWEEVERERVIMQYRILKMAIGTS